MDMKTMLAGVMLSHWHWDKGFMVDLIVLMIPRHGVGGDLSTYHFGHPAVNSVHQKTSMT